MPSSTRSRDMNRLKKVYPSVKFAAKMLRSVEQPTAAVTFNIDNARIDISNFVAGSYTHIFTTTFTLSPIVVVDTYYNGSSPLLAVTLSDLSTMGVTVNTSAMLDPTSVYIVIRALEPWRGSRVYDFNRVRTVYPKKHTYSTLGSSNFYAMTTSAANAVQAGITTITSNDTAVITFPYEMPSVPTISYAMLDSSTHTPAYIEDITTSGFSIRFSTNVTCQLHWEALLESYT